MCSPRWNFVLWRFPGNLAENWGLKRRLGGDCNHFWQTCWNQAVEISEKCSEKSILVRHPVADSRLSVWVTVLVEFSFIRWRENLCLRLLRWIFIAKQLNCRSLCMKVLRSFSMTLFDNGKLKRHRLGDFKRLLTFWKKSWNFWNFGRHLSCRSRLSVWVKKWYLVGDLSFIRWRENLCLRVNPGEFLSQKLNDRSLCMMIAIIRQTWWHHDACLNGKSLKNQRICSASDLNLFLTFWKKFEISEILQIFQILRWHFVLRAVCWVTVLAGIFVHPLTGKYSAYDLLENFYRKNLLTSGAFVMCSPENVSMIAFWMVHSKFDIGGDFSKNDIWHFEKSLKFLKFLKFWISDLRYRSFGGMLRSRYFGGYFRSSVDGKIWCHQASCWRIFIAKILNAGAFVCVLRSWILWLAFWMENSKTTSVI